MSLYESNIWKLYLYKVLTSLQITVPIYVLFLMENGLSMTQVMFLQSFYTFLIFLFEIPSGAFADIWGRKLTLITSSSFLALAFLVFGVGASYPVFFVAAFIWAVAKSLLSGADIALLYDTLKSLGRTHLFPRYSGRTNSVEMLTLGISSIIGGTLATYTGNRLLFFLTAIIFATSLIVAFSFRRTRYHKEIVGKGYLKHLFTSASFAFTHATVRRYLIFFAFFGFFAYMLYFLIQPFFTQGVSTRVLVGVAVAGYFIFCSLGSYVAEHIIRRIQAGRLVLLFLIASAFAFILMPLVPTWIAVFLVFINSFVVGVAGILANDKINQNTKSQHRATVLSVLNFMQKIIYAVIAPLIGYVSDTYTLGAAFIALGIGVSVLFAYYAFIYAINRFSLGAHDG